MIEISAMTAGHKHWNDTISLAENCSWKAGYYLADLMKQNRFLEWERVFVACEARIETIREYVMLVIMHC